jgi:N-acetylglucosaminyl-diphospho-decaprenol L-rhamnosyltransferase
MTDISWQRSRGTKRADIVIVNWNSGRVLRQCVTALDQSTIANVLRVIIVDNASTDGSMDAVTASRLELIFIKNEKNLGFAAASNCGAAYGNTEHIIFLNPDVQVQSDTIERTLQFLAGPQNSDVGIAGIQLLDSNGCIQRSCARKSTIAALLLQTVFLDRVVPRLISPHFLIEWDHRKTRQVDQVMGAYLAIRRVLFQHIGGFDERFFLYFEDLDLCLRASSAGWKTVYFSGTAAEHMGGSTTAAIKVRRMLYFAISRLKYALKWHGFSVAIPLILLTCCVEIPARLAFLAAQKFSYEILRKGLRFLQ